MRPASRSLLTTGKRQWRSRPLSEWGFVVGEDVRRTTVQRTFCIYGVVALSIHWSNSDRTTDRGATDSAAAIIFSDVAMP